MKKFLYAIVMLAFIQACGLVNDSGKVQQGDEGDIDQKPAPSVDAFENYCKSKNSGVFTKEHLTPNNPMCRYIAQIYTLPNRDFKAGELIHVGNFPNIGIQTYLKEGDVSLFINSKFYKRNTIDPVAIDGGNIDLQINTKKVKEYQLIIYVCENIDKIPSDCNGLL